MDYQTNLVQNKEYKEINFNEITKINIIGEEMNKNKNSENKKNDVDDKNTKNYKLNNHYNIEYLTLKLSKLMNSMKKNPQNKKEINKSNIKDFKRSIFIDYSGNKNLTFPFNSIDNLVLTEKEINYSRIQEKENLQNNIFLGNKSKREFIKEFDNQNILNNISNEEDNQSFVIVKDGIIKIKTNDVIEKNDNNELYQINYKTLLLIKKLLKELNYTFTIECTKLYKKICFYISNILFIIKLNKDNSKVVEINEKKGDKKTKIVDEQIITKELNHIKSYLEKKNI